MAESRSVNEPIDLAAIRAKIAAAKATPRKSAGDPMAEFARLQAEVNINILGALTALETRVRLLEDQLKGKLT